MYVKYNTDKYNKIKQELGHVYTLFYTHPSSIHPKEYIVHTDKILNLNKVFKHISHIIHVTAGGTTHYQNNFVIPFSCLMPPSPPLILLSQFHDILATAYIV